MIIFAKSIDDFKNYFNSVLLVEHYPQAFFINLFIDEKMKNEIIPVNSIMMTDKPKFEITIDYDNADAQLSAFLNDINACDLLFTKDKDVTSGLKIRIKNNERNEEMKTMNFNDAFKREKFDVSKTDAEGLGKKLTQFIKNRKAKYYVQRGFNMGDIADAYVAGCNNMWDLMMSKIADSVKAYKSDIGNETLTVNQAAEIFKYLLDNMKPDFEVVKENTQKAQTTIEDVTNAYENFANANLKMLADLAAQRKIAVLNNSKTPFIDALENDNKISSEDARNARVIYNCVCEECDDRMKFALLEYLCTLNSNNELLIFALDTLYSIGKATKDETTKNNIKNLFNKCNYSVDGSNDRKVQKLIDSYNDTMSRMVFVDGVK